MYKAKPIKNRYRYAYILAEFPKISETFIVNEILEITKKSDTEVNVFAFHNPREDKVHPRVRDVKKLIYLPQTNKFKKIYAHLFFLFLNPKRYINTFRVALKSENYLRGAFKNYLYSSVLIFKSKPNHIHAHFGLDTTDLALLIHLLTGIGYTFTTHRWDIFDYPPNNYRIKSKFAKKHVTISNFNKDYIVREFNVEKSQISVVCCGVNVEQLSLQMDETADNIIFCAARLIKQKGLDVLLSACSKLRKLNIRFKCLIAGDGYEKPNLERQIISLGIKNNVELLGNKCQEEIVELLSKATIFALPSRSEGIPVALMEAMAMRVPVVSTNVCGIPELVEDGKSGILIQPDDIDGLTQALKKLLADKDLRLSFAEVGYEKVFRNFNIKNQIDKLLHIYQS